MKRTEKKRDFALYYQFLGSLPNGLSSLAPGRAWSGPAEFALLDMLAVGPLRGTPAAVYLSNAALWLHWTRPLCSCFIPTCLHPSL